LPVTKTAAGKLGALIPVGGKDGEPVEPGELRGGLPPPVWPWAAAEALNPKTRKAQVKSELLIAHTLRSL
jgi:hypothetical protein